MGHREDIRSLLEGITVHGVVHDWGSGSKPVERYVKGEAAFIKLDQHDNIDFPVQHVVDIQKIIEIAEQADFAFCMEVLEHTTQPLRVLENIYANLKEGGKLYLSVPFLYPEHGDKDYIRLTKYGLEYYLEEAGFKDIKINPIEQGYTAEATK